MSIYSHYETEDKAEINGVWFPNPAGFEVLIARAGGANEKYRAAVIETAREFNVSVGQTDATPEEEIEMMKKVYSETIVLDWRGEGAVDRENKPFPYSPKNCMTYFNDLPDFYVWVRTKANQMQNYRKSRLEQEGKNS